MPQKKPAHYLRPVMTYNNLTVIISTDAQRLPISGSWTTAVQVVIDDENEHDIPVHLHLLCVGQNFYDLPVAYPNFLAIECDVTALVKSIEVSCEVRNAPELHEFVKPKVIPHYLKLPNLLFLEIFKPDEYTAWNEPIFRTKSYGTITSYIIIVLKNYNQQ